MTTKKSDEGKKNLENFLSYTSKLEEQGKNEQSKNHPDAGVSNSYNSKQKKFVESYLAENHPNVDASKLSSEQIGQFYNIGMRSLQNFAAKALKDVDSILENIDPKKLNSGLEKMLGNEELAPIVMGAASKEDRDTLVKYQAYAQQKAVVDQYEKTGKFANKEVQQLVYSIAQSGARKETIDRLKKAGLSDENAELGAQLEESTIASGAYREDKIKEYALKGLKEQLSKLEKETPADKYSAAVANTVKALVTSKKTNDYNIGSQMIYDAAK